MRAPSPVLVVNPRSGGGRAQRSGLAAAARERGWRVRELTAGEEVAAVVREAGGPLVAVAGGDGSHAAGAAVAIERGVPLLPVPCGSLNHFADDAGFDIEDPVAALDVAGGEPVAVDAARAGERVFLNTLSLGVYAAMVAERDYREHRLRTGRRVLARERPTSFTFDGPDGRVSERVPLLVVSNNVHAPGSVERERLDAGVLQVGAVLGDDPRRLRRAVLRAGLLHRVEPEDGWLTWLTAELEIAAEVPEVPAALDGEAAVLALPLRVQVLAGALRLLAPPEPAGRRGFALGRARRLLG